jgi:hypothetical protein
MYPNYDEVKIRHIKLLSLPSAIISSIMFIFLISVFLLMTNEYGLSDKQSAQNLSVVSNTTNITTAANAVNN